MFSAHGDPSMASIAYQSARDDDGTSDQASVGPYWTQKKSTEEMLRENEAKKISPKATQSKPTSVSPYGRQKVYMKSIEQMVPYNKLAMHSKEVEKYLELDPANKVEYSQKDDQSTQNLKLVEIDQRKMESRNRNLASQLPGGEYDLNDWTSKIDLSPLKATPNHVIQEVDGE